MTAYHTWALDNGRFIIEKFEGEYTIEQVNATTEVVLSLAKKGEPISVLVELMDGRVGFPVEKITETTEMYVEALTDHPMISFALVVSIEETQDVAFTFALESSNHQLPSMTFHSVTSALDWLDINDDLREEALTLLMKGEPGLSD